MTNNELVKAFDAFKTFALRHNYGVGGKYNKEMNTYFLKFKRPRGNDFGMPVICATVDLNKNSCVYEFKYKKMNLGIDGLDALQANIGMINEFILPDLTKTLKEIFEGLEIKNV